jgi:steroid 5-alpha reductase family enzyme
LKGTIMKDAEKKALIAIPIVILIGVGVALAGSQGSALAFGLPLFGLGVAYAFALNWLVFIFAYIKQTEKFFDLTGSLTYISLTVLAVLLSPVRDARSWLLMALVLVWAGRLGSFLFLRIRKAGKDDRFDELKVSFVRFLNVWTIQGLWVTFTLAAALAAITTANRKPLGIFALVGFLVWVLGFTFEAVADAQKNRFRADPANKGKFISTGLWSRSRHPNYFGEMTLWLGVAIIALPVLSGWQWVAMISPIFVFLLLTRVSGVPMLEKKADTKWGGQEDYEAYKKNTPVLFPKL